MKKIVIVSLMILLLTIPMISYADVMSSLEGHWASKLVDSEFTQKYFPYFNNSESAFNPNEAMKISNFILSLDMLIKDYEDTEAKTEDTEKKDIEEKAITRIEAVRLIVSSYNNINLNKIEVAEKNPFTDLHELEEKDIDNVLKAHKLGIINGYSDGTFKSEDSVSQIQGILLLQRLKESLDLKTTSIPFKVLETNKYHSGVLEGVDIKDTEDKILVTVTKRFSTSGYKMNIDKIEKSKDNMYNIYLKIDKPNPNMAVLQVITYESITIEIDSSQLEGAECSFSIITEGLNTSPIVEDKIEY